MTDDLRWAARYAFCEELWRDRPRVVWDRHVESALGEHPGVPQRRRGDDPDGTGDPPRTGDDEADEPEAALRELLEGLVPAGGRRGSDGRGRRIDVSMGVADEATGRRLAPRRPATQFLTLAPLCDAIRRRDWAVALVDLSDLLVSDGPGESSRLSVRGAELVDALSSRLADGDRTVVVSVVAADADLPGGLQGGADPLAFGVDYDGLLDMIAPLLDAELDVRIYALLKPPMTAIVELGMGEEDDALGEEHTAEVIPRGPASDGTLRVARLTRASDARRAELDDDAQTAEVQRPGGARRGSGAWRDGKPRGARWSEGNEFETTTPVVHEPPAAAEAAAGADDVPLSYDNTLGSREPQAYEYVAVVGVGAVRGVAEGMTLVELPPGAEPAPVAQDEEPPPPLRAQLAESRRQADLAAIERNGLVERLDDLESANVTLTAEASELRDRLARALAEAPEPGAAEDPQRLDAARAEVQSLRWELTRVNKALDAARARPVPALEAEVARLTAQLQQGPDSEGAPGEVATTPEDLPVSPPAAGLSVAERPTTEVNGSKHAASGRQSQADPRGGTNGARGPTAGARRSLLREVDALLHRIERSDISALELRQRLLAVRRGL
ncbi:MAG: hypothetical protein AAF721_32825, partial [Myxococcota bacterium]